MRVGDATCHCALHYSPLFVCVVVIARVLFFLFHLLFSLDLFLETPYHPPQYTHGTLQTELARLKIYKLKTQ